MRRILVYLGLVLAASTGGGMKAQQPVISNVELSSRSSEGAVRGGGITLRDVRLVSGGVEMVADEARLGRADGRLRLVLAGGGTVTVSEGATVRLVSPTTGNKPTYDPAVMSVLRPNLDAMQRR